MQRSPECERPLGGKEMILDISIMGTVNESFKSEHDVIKKISDMFTQINKLEFKKHQEG